MYPLWWPNHIVLVYVSKVVKNLHVVCETKQECISVSYYEDLRHEKIKYTHTQSNTSYNSHIS